MTRQPAGAVEGVALPERALVKVVESPQESLSLVRDLSRDSSELLMMFSTPQAFVRQVRAATLEDLRTAPERGASVKVMVPRRDGSAPMIEKAREGLPGLNVRETDESLATNTTVLVADRSRALVVETADDSVEELLPALGTSIYAESRSFAAFYAAMFDSIWKQTETYEKLKLQEKLQSDFVNIAAHELRTPVQAIINYAELATENAENKDEYYGKLLKNVTRLQKLTEDILDAARIDSGALKLNWDSFDLASLVEGVAEESRVACESKGVNLVLLPSAEVIVEGDSGRIARVVSNLLSNALKFTEKGSIKVWIEANREDNRVSVRVADTGTGVDPSIMPVLFSRFVAKSRSGTGLGLYISKNIVEEHGGKIWVENSPGRGATFAVEIPIAQRGAAAKSRRAPASS